MPERLEVFRTRLLDRALISDELMGQALSDDGEWLAERLDREFMKDSLQRRQELFRLRSYDRTVHPTQMYSLQAELALDAIVSGVGRAPARRAVARSKSGAGIGAGISRPECEHYLAARGRRNPARPRHADCGRGICRALYGHDVDVLFCRSGATGMAAIDHRARDIGSSPRS